MKTISVLLLTLLCLGCGYSAPKAAQPQPGAVPRCYATCAEYR
jgi:hypothetical protein